MQIGEILQRLFKNPWIPKKNREGKPFKPNQKQMKALLMQDVFELFFGGAVGGGKSTYFLLDGALYLDVPGYAALILRKTRDHLYDEGGLVPMSKEWWLGHKGAGYGKPHYNGALHKWTFPTRVPNRPATITFGYMNREDDEFKYGSTEFQRAYFDEVPEIRPHQFRFLFARIRGTRDITAVVPTAVRSAGNPVGPYVEYYKKRYVDKRTRDPDTMFIASTLDDNIDNIDVELYEKSLRRLDPINYQQLRHGNWEVREKGRMFDRSWFSVWRGALPFRMRAVRYWDLAATEAKRGKSPSWTSGALMATPVDGPHVGKYYLMDIQRRQDRPKVIQDLIVQTAHVDRTRLELYSYEVWMEQEPGSSGVSEIDRYTTLLQGFTFRADKVTGSKALRANPLSSYSEGGNVYLVPGRWNNTFLDEIEAFPDGMDKDQVDSVGGAFNKLTQKTRSPKFA